MALTLREKIAHLYRRFSFGPTLAEIDEGEVAGLDATIKKLIDYDSSPANFNVHPFEFVWNEKDDADPGAYQFRYWWCLAMSSTKRPLQEKLALFWHSHFAVSDIKVEHGPMMLDYLQVLRKNANGKFVNLLKGVSKSPAMMKYLDMDRALRGNPNENFAREVMELFTMGIGNYTETDVKEVSRALTGWGYMETFWEAGTTNNDRVKALISAKRPGAAFCYMPGMRDDGPKTILGKTQDFDGDTVLEFLANQPATADFICRRLWEFFAYPSPEPSVMSKLTGAFHSSKGDIKQVLFAIARSPEFWSDRCVLRSIKSPADYVIGMTRQMGLGQSLLEMRPKDARPDTRIVQKIRDETGYMAYRLEKMGLNLMYPPDVSGWKWGPGWVSAAMMAERMQYHGQMIWNDKGPYVATENVMKQMTTTPIANTEALTKRFTEVFDLNLNPAAQAQVVAKFNALGGKAALDNKDSWAGAMYNVIRMLSAAPDMHIC